MKKCEICLDTQDQHEIVQPFNDNYWVHNDCYGDAVAEAKFQEAEDRYNGFYEETPVDDGWTSEQRAYYENGPGAETHYIDRDGNLIKREEV
tara:strand:+ start:727 stop:1002 length:276 start_codon:yes stop_codon:yes gene_type:complete